MESFFFSDFKLGNEDRQNIFYMLLIMGDSHRNKYSRHNNQHFIKSPFTCTHTYHMAYIHNETKRKKNHYLCDFQRQVRDTHDHHDCVILCFLVVAAAAAVASFLSFFLFLSGSFTHSLSLLLVSFLARKNFLLRCTPCAAFCCA